MRGGAEQLLAPFAASDNVVPFNLLVILRTLGAAGDVLVRRGWEVEPIDTEGAGFLWLAFGLMSPQYFDEMDMPITRVVLSSNMTVEYALAGCPVLTRHPPRTLPNLVDQTAALERSSRIGGRRGSPIKPGVSLSTT